MRLEQWPKVLYYCAYQERCVSEVIQKLRILGIPASEYEEIIHRLKAENYLDEKRYCSAYIRGKFWGKKWGKQKVFAGLRSKQVSKALVQEVWSNEISSSDYKEQCITLARQEYQKYKKVPVIKKRAKIYSYLHQKGYESELIREVTSSLESDVTGGW